MRKYVSLVLAALMVATCLTACGVSPEKQAEKTIITCFDALKAGDMETAASYIEGTDIAEKDDDAQDSAMNETMTKAVFERLNYTILSSALVDDSTVTVKVEISNVDMKPVFGDFFAQAIQYAFSNAFSDEQSAEDSNKKMEEIFNSCISKEDLATVTKEVDVKVVKEGESWIIAGDDTLANALLGGLMDAVKELEDSFSSIG